MTQLYTVIPPTETLAAQTVRYDEFVRKLFKQDTPQMMRCHAAMGLAEEAGELMTQVKRDVHYGKPVDIANVVEELGDVMFYLHAVMQVYGITLGEVLAENARKLSIRYRNLEFSEQQAIARADKNGQK